MAEDPRAEARRNQQRQLEATLEEMGTVLVRAGRDDSRVALWDTGPEYEGGEVMIKGHAGDPDKDFVYELPRTAMVMQKIREGALIEADDDSEGAGPAPEPVAMRLTPEGNEMPAQPSEGERAQEEMADKRERQASAEEKGESATAATATSDKPASAAPHGGSTPSTSESAGRGKK
jgi:hypothetical protein